MRKVEELLPWTYDDTSDFRCATGSDPSPGIGRGILINYECLSPDRTSSNGHKLMSFLFLWIWQLSLVRIRGLRDLDVDGYSGGGPELSWIPSALLDGVGLAETTKHGWLNASTDCHHGRISMHQAHSFPTTYLCNGILSRNLHSNIKHPTLHDALTPILTDVHQPER